MLVVLRVRCRLAPLEPLALVHSVLPLLRWVRLLDSADSAVLLVLVLLVLLLHARSRPLERPVLLHLAQDWAVLPSHGHSLLQAASVRPLLLRVRSVGLPHDRRLLRSAAVLRVQAACWLLVQQALLLQVWLQVRRQQRSVSAVLVVLSAVPLQLQLLPLSAAHVPQLLVCHQHLAARCLAQPPLGSVHHGPPSVLCLVPLVPLLLVQV